MAVKLIEVLGPGCAKCELLAQYAQQAAHEIGLEYQIVKVKEPAALARYGALMTPALVVDGRLVLQGRLLSAEKLKELLT